MIIKILKNDFKKNILEQWMVLFFIAIITIVVSFLFVLDMNKYYAKDSLFEITYVDAIIFMFKGMAKYIPSDKSVFTIEWRYMLWNIFLSLIIGYASSKFGKKEDIFNIIKCRNRGRWYWSKVIWGLLTVAFGYFFIMINILCGTLIGSLFIKNVRFKRGFGYNQALCESICGVGENIEKMFWTFLLFCFISFVFLCLLQMILIITFNSFMGYVGVIFVLVFSGYYDRWFMVGNAQMLYRYASEYNSFSSFISYLVFAISAIVIFLLVGRFIVEKKDYLDK